ncbi:MAG: glycosyltransferase [Patescibacteria group bacterium]
MKLKNSEKIKLSIIIVHYRVKNDLFNCIDSINKSNPNVSYEVIVVDNDEQKTIEKELKKKFPKVKYIKSPGNIGFGAGNNLGARYAEGSCFFFLNPDTIVSTKAIDALFKFIHNKKNVGVVAPLLYDMGNKVYSQQGSRSLGVLEGIVVLSFLNKLFPNNYISKKYLLASWNKINTQEVDVVPGTAFMIKKRIFEKVGGFEEKLFLYFEEFDICNRVKNLGYNIYIVTDAKVKHLWGVSTKKANFDIKKIFEKSRFYYFRKHYGLVSAYLVEVFTRLNKTHLLLGFILTFGAFLRLYRLQELMPFIGDQGWFYLSARDMILTGNIPLVGITSSHVWLHQGPLWTYILSLMLSLFNFNPISGVYLTVFLGIITILVIYISCSDMFSKKVGIIAASFYAMSPLTIMHSRFAYHTSPIPLFTILFILFLYKWVSGKSIYFPLIIFTLAILYNLELATASLWFVLISILIYGFWKKKPWLKNTYKKNIILLSIVSFIIPMLPVIVYDINHRFPQTVGFAVWIVYKVFKFVIHFGQLSVLNNNGSLLLSFFYNNIQRLLFLPDGRVAVLLFITSLSYFFYSLYQMHKNKKYNIGHIIIANIFIISGIGLFINQTPSEAYLPMFFPLVIIIQALLMFNVLNKKHFSYAGILLFILIAFINSYSIINNGYSYIRKEKNITFTDRLNASHEIISYSKGNKYNLIGKGWLSEFDSYTMNYQYLTWWMGNAPAKENSEIKIFVTEEKGKIIIEKKTIKVNNFL